MDKLWNEIKARLLIIAPEIHDGLNDGVENEQIQYFKQKIDATLPMDFLAFYEIHNGQEPDVGGLIECEELLSFERILDEW